MMHAREKSDEAIVAGKPANEAGQSAEELVERRAEAKGNACRQAWTGHSAGLPCYRRWQSHTPGLFVEACRLTRGGSRMREFRTYGSVRGALSNGRPYRYVRRETGKE